MLASSHLGKWAGPNRLWLDDPVQPERSEGRIEAQATSLQYAWAFRDEPQSGVLNLGGPAAAVHARWTDTFHAADGMDLYGESSAGLLRLFGCYAGFEGVEWGWNIEIDLRDPEHISMRMFNVQPGHDPVIAVDLYASRVG